MQESKSSPKELIINNTLYAHYLIENEIMYLKTRKDLVPGNKERSETLLAELIALVEKRQIPYVAYLNIK